MTVDLDIICIKDGIPVDMHFFDEMFLENVGEHPRPIYNYLNDHVKPIFEDKLSEYAYQGKRYYGYVVWEITEKIAIEILKHILEERRYGGSGSVIDDWEIASKVEEWPYFDDGRRVFIVY